MVHYSKLGKETFVVDHYELCEKVFKDGLPCDKKSLECSLLLNFARVELGYSTNTYWQDIFHSINRVYQYVSLRRTASKKE